MRAIAYIRVSSEEQVHGTSLGSQRKACLEYAKSNGIELAEKDVFSEEGVSAKLIDRPELGNMLNFLAENKGKVQACIVWKVDRLARKSEYHHLIKTQLSKLGVKLVSVTEPIGDDPTGSLMESMLAAFAQFDNDIRTLRTSAGMRARTEQGGWPHQPPYGFKKLRLPSGVASLERDVTEGPIITVLLEKFATGNFTVKQITDIAYEMGITNKRGGKRGWESIKWLLVNPLYAGFVSTKLIDGKYVKGLHKPLISEATHFKIIAIINGDIKKYSKQAELDWPLRGGFLVHEACGNPVTGSAPTGRNGPSPRYHCTKCKATKTSHVSKSRARVHKDFLELVGRISPDEPVKRLFKEIVLRRWNTEYKQALSHNARLHGEIDGAEQKRARILDLFIEGKLTDVEKTDKLLEVDKGLTMLKLQSMEAGQYIDQKELIIDSALLFMSDPATFWNLADIEVKKRVQDAVFPEGLAYNFDNGFGTVKLAEPYLLIQKIADPSATNQSLAQLTLTKWNQIKSELIAMWQVLRLINQTNHI